ARERGLRLEVPASVVETPGTGLEGRIGREPVVIGRPDFVLGRLDAGTAAADPKRVPEPGASPMAVAIGGAVRAMLVLADVVREAAAAALRGLRGRGVRRAVLVPGDRADVATVIAGNLGLDAWTADATPAGKVRIVAAERQRGITMMVGDGI